MEETFTCEALAGACDKLDDLFSVDEHSETWKVREIWNVILVS